MSLLLWINLVLCALLTPLLTWRLRGPEPAQRRWMMAAVVLMMLHLLIPLAVPARLLPLRFLVVVISFAGVGKLLLALLPEERLEESPGTHLLRHLWPAESRWDPESARATVSPSLGRLLLLVAATVVLLRLALQGVVPPEGPARTLWQMLLLYLSLAAGTELYALPFRLCGMQLQPIFRAPFLSRSPRDFWSRRWNLWFSRTAHRVIFLPLGGSERPLFAVSAVFLFSALAHESLTLYCLGQVDGRMLSFFLLHGAVTLLTAWRWPWSWTQLRWPRPLAITAHWLWMLVTAPLFMEPAKEMLLLDDWPAAFGRLL